jgi:Fe-S cluster assembly protein SufD
MTIVQENTDLKSALLNQFEKFQSSLEGKALSPLHQKRKEAIESFKRQDFPTVKHEEWKYTNVAPLLKTAFNLEANRAKAGISTQEIQSYALPLQDANVLVFVNGNYQPEQSTILSPVHEITIMDMANAEDKRVEALDKYFATLADVEQDGFTAMNTAFTNHGAFIQVPAGKVVERPVILYYITNSKVGNLIAQPRNLFVAGENSQATILEVYASVGENTSLTNTVTEIYVGQQAIIDYYKLQVEETNDNHIGTTQVYQEKASNFSSTTITLNGGLTRNNLNIILDAEHCEAHMNGLYLLDGKMHVDNHTLVDHKKPNSYSNEFYKGVMADKSNGVFNGKIFVRQDAQKTNAFQSNRNILLSDEATINTKPQLEIFADDVKCSHGATTGQLDEEALYYLRSRGLSKESARALLLHAFAQEVIERIKLKPLKAYLEEKITAKLHIAQ